MQIQSSVIAKCLGELDSTLHAKQRPSLHFLRKVIETLPSYGGSKNLTLKKRQLIQPLNSDWTKKKKHCLLFLKKHWGQDYEVYNE